MRRLLRLVTTEGSGKRAAIDGYMVGGKTGTAEKAGDGRYDRKRRITSFVAAFPMQQPRYVVMVMVDEPKPTKDTFGFATAGWTAAPVVKRIIAQTAPLLGIQPVDEKSPEMLKAMRVGVEN